MWKRGIVFILGGEEESRRVTIWNEIHLRVRTVMEP